MKFLFTKPWLKSLAGLCLNLSATWFSLLFLTSRIPVMHLFDLISDLIRNLIFGIVFLKLSVDIEKYLNEYK